MHFVVVGGFYIRLRLGENAADSLPNFVCETTALGRGGALPQRLSVVVAHLGYAQRLRLLGRGGLNLLVREPIHGRLLHHGDLNTRHRDVIYATDPGEERTVRIVPKVERQGLVHHLRGGAHRLTPLALGQSLLHAVFLADEVFVNLLRRFFLSIELLVELLLCLLGVFLLGLTGLESHLVVVLHFLALNEVQARRLRAQGPLHRSCASLLRSVRSLHCLSFGWLGSKRTCSVDFATLRLRRLLGLLLGLLLNLHSVQSAFLALDKDTDSSVESLQLLDVVSVVLFVTSPIVVLDRRLAKQCNPS